MGHHGGRQSHACCCLSIHLRGQDIKDKEGDNGYFDPPLPPVCLVKDIQQTRNKAKLIGYGFKETFL